MDRVDSESYTLVVLFTFFFCKGIGDVFKLGECSSIHAAQLSTQSLPNSALLCNFCEVYVAAFKLASNICFNLENQL